MIIIKEFFFIGKLYDRESISLNTAFESFINAKRINMFVGKFSLDDVLLKSLIYYYVIYYDIKNELIFFIERYLSY